MSVSYVWGKEKRCQFDRTEKEEKGGGTLEMWLQMYFADDCSKSFRSCFCFADDDGWLKTLGKFFHQLFSLN